MHMLLVQEWSLDRYMCINNIHIGNTDQEIQLQLVLLTFVSAGRCCCCCTDELYGCPPVV